ncbi:hypothetical protein SAMN05216524_104632 [Mucilaginibacter sp. OK098]|nr:hypothetical protein SAMN05216524_104632 [Mucilaginibacter sp. OK098]
MRGNDVVLQLDEKLNKVFIMLRIKLFAQSVAAEPDTAKGILQESYKAIFYSVVLTYPLCFET